MSSRVIVHIDLNAFFVRCEEIKNPSLENKAVAIGHSGRKGIISTCSYEARKYGVRSGMPTFKALELCPHLILKPVDFNYYHALSRQFFNFIKGFTNLIEVASIDELFADFTLQTKNVKDVVAYFKKIQDKLFLQTKLKCSIGVAPTKFLAKMASDYKKPMGITIIRKRDISKMLFPLDIKDMFGIGSKTLPRLKSLNINTIGDLYEKINANDENVKNILGKFFFTAEKWLNGEGDDAIQIEREDPKSIGNSSTLLFDTDDYDIIKNMIYILSKEVSDRAKKEGKIGSTIQLSLKDPNFIVKNKSVTFENPTNDSTIIFDKAMSLFDNFFVGKTVRLLGVTLQNLISPKDISIQMTFFNFEKHEEENKTKLLINDLNRKLSKPMLKRASEVERKVK